MTINYTPEGGSVVSLAGTESDLADGPLGLTMSADAIMEETPIIRAAYPYRVARGNRTYRAGFSVRKKHTDYEAAHAYVLAHVQEFNNVGSAVFTQGSAVLTLTKAQVRAQGVSAGATSEWTYEITGIKT